ncbi:Katanin p60 ATPase-containing subunit A-like 2 [Polyrhizophydium stewartii]|uniref:Katanin p60 ATPase-containing subunit A-like 2 n=1 Tax=Polyrhizophydium stewartii TaxID=2732419 RepID=A0ABR4NKA0_9FUNG
MFGHGDGTLAKLKASSEARQADEERAEQRKRNVLVLILHHLQSFGYLESVERLQAESNVSLRKVTAADNMDLLTIVQEFESYYLFKFGKPPRLVRKNASGEAPDPPAQRHARRSPTPAISKSSVPNEQRPQALSRSVPLPRIGRAAPQQGQPQAQPPRDGPSAATIAKRTAESGPEPNLLIEAVGTRVNGNAPAAPHPPNINATGIAPAAEMPHHASEASESLYESRLLKPMPDYANAEFRELASIITRDIFQQNPNVKWGDIAGLQSSKQLIKEAIVFPIKFPSLFTGILRPWKGLLLFGPPGTGKTMLAKAVATECRTTFFNISASSIVSKWRGDSEKLIRVLFELARHHSPSTIFLDELEARPTSIMSQRSSDGAEHEGSRRMKTELLIQMDGLAKSREHVFLLAASNLPWDLDVAMLRRLEKRILVDLPDSDARLAIFEALLPAGQCDEDGQLLVDELDYSKLSELTEGYSGSDINLVCREAAMRPLRRVFAQLEQMPELTTEGADLELLHGAASTLPASERPAIAREPIRNADVLAAIACTKPTSSEQLNARYREWQSSFASV